MPPIARKLCLVGEPGVGKTSLVRALLADVGAQGDANPLIAAGPQGVGADRGIQLSECDLGVDGESLPVTVWDLAGSSALDTLNQAFLSGLDGVMAVADASRPASAATALRLVQQIRRLHPGTPAVLLLNKRDLAVPVAIDTPPGAGVDVFEASARDTGNVRAAFAALAQRIADGATPRRAQ
jgi:small GTP-binding protein